MRKHGLSSTDSATATTATLLTLLVSFAAVARAQDYTSSFESNSITADGWSNGGTSYTWDTTSGSTPSIDTGPASAASGSYYAFIETSSGSTGDYFSLSQTFSSDVSLLSFYYSMYGDTIGTLRVDVSSDAFSSYTTIWSKSGNQGTSAWSYASLTPSGSYDSIRFYATRGSSYTGDISLDYIEVTTGSSPSSLPIPNPTPVPTPVPTTSVPTPVPSPVPTTAPTTPGPTSLPTIVPSPVPTTTPVPTTPAPSTDNYFTGQKEHASMLRKAKHDSAVRKTKQHKWAERAKDRLKIN